MTRRLISCVALCAFATGCDSSLSGKPSPTPYPCGTPSSGHCYAEAILGDHITGFRTTLTVARQFLPGDGFITNEFWLTNYVGTNGWIEIGYVVTSHFRQHYFWAQLDPATSLFTSHDIGDVPAEDLGARVTVDVHQIADDQFQLSLEGGATPFTTTIGLHLWEGTTGGYVKVGQELQGTTGAAASLTVFVENQVYYGQDSRRHVVIEQASESIGAPPYGGWLEQPSASAEPDAGGSPGGVFSTYCCAR